jgi:hypothetical protein
VQCPLTLQQGPCCGGNPPDPSDTNCRCTCSSIAPGRHRSVCRPPQPLLRRHSRRRRRAACRDSCRVTSSDSIPRGHAVVRGHGKTCMARGMAFKLFSSPDHEGQPQMFRTYSPHPAGGAWQYYAIAQHFPRDADAIAALAEATGALRYKGPPPVTDLPLPSSPPGWWSTVHAATC